MCVIIICIFSDCCNLHTELYIVFQDFEDFFKAKHASFCLACCVIYCIEPVHKNELSNFAVLNTLLFAFLYMILQHQVVALLLFLTVSICSMDGGTCTHMEWTACKSEPAS